MTRSLDVNKYAHVYISPHLDDAVLSCGGRIWQQAQMGEPVLVVTVFAATPASDTSLSPFAQELHTRWGHLADAVARRQDEDLAALALLGAEAAHWSYTDCVYRQAPDGHFPYASEEALWAEIHPSEKRGLVIELAARLKALPFRQDGDDARAPTVYAPLGVGHHVDHQIVRCAAEASDRRLTYYEEYPYAQDLQAVRAALGGRRWQVRRVSLSAEALRAKIAAIGCYRSQLSTFWASLAEMDAAIRAFAERSSDGEPTEQYWQLKR
jgi:LmbE family N-acetylglucosaminyl deacetylase